MATDAPIETSAGGEDGNVLTRKLGPLPTWGWALVVVGAILVARALRGGSTGGQSVPGTIPVGDVTDGPGTGITALPGPAGPTGPAGTFPAGYSNALNSITEWFQRLDATTRLIARLSDAVRRADNPREKKKLQAALDKATGKDALADGKFTYGGKTYYQVTFINKQINELQKTFTGG